MGYTLDQGMSENDIKTTLISEEEKFVRSVLLRLGLLQPLTAGSAVADLRPVRLHRDPRRALGRRGR